MVIRRVANEYDQLNYERRQSWDPGDVEILQLRDRRPYDEHEEQEDIVDPNKREGTPKLPNTGKAAHDDDFLLPTRTAQYRQQYSTKRRFLTGWRIGVVAALLGTTLIFTFNAAYTIYVWCNAWNYPVKGSVATLFFGSCAKVRSLNVWAHLLVNTLSTLLLVGSNFCMQVLASPNRAEVVRAHMQRHWMHIGVPNMRNLNYISKARVAIWALLFLSSVPLHLLFNSVIFTNLQANEYVVVPTKEDWIYGAPYDTSRLIDTTDVNGSLSAAFDTYRVVIQDLKKKTMYHNVSATECFDYYNGQYLSNVGNLYIIQEQPAVYRNASRWVFNASATVWEELDTLPTSWLKNPDIRFPFMSSPRLYPSNGWMCPNRSSTICDVNDETEIPRNRLEWAPYESLIRHCLVEIVYERCELQLSFTIAVVVIISNLIKMICMALTLYKYKDHEALVTIGDAVVSFLDDPDPETYGRCLHTKRNVGLRWNWNEYANMKKAALSTEPQRYRMRKRRWGSAPGPIRWFFTYFGFAVAALVSIPSIYLSLRGMPRDPVKLWRTGFATVRGNNLLNFNTSLLGGVLLANTPQALLSYLYLAFNGLYTSMFVAREWHSYIHERKPLRVTSPIGQQRDTYWLNVPFRYAIPTTILSGLLHWLASQSLFKVQISITSSVTRQVFDEISTCGYSPVAIILTTATVTFIAVVGLIMSRFWYPAGIPLASTNSAAISAACHAAPEDGDASHFPVQWGAITHGKVGDDGEEPVGHCCFSSLPVEMPIPGRQYA